MVGGRRVVQASQDTGNEVPEGKRSIISDVVGLIKFIIITTVIKEVGVPFHREVSLYLSAQQLQYVHVQHYLHR